MQLLKRVPLTIGGVLGLIVVTAGCSTLRPISAARTLDGQPANQVRVVLSEPYTFTPGLVDHTLPAGTYTPVFEDDDGVYFQSPSKLLLGDVTGPTLHDGGLFFERGESTRAYDYMVIHGQHSNWRLPSNFECRVERTNHQ